MTVSIDTGDRPNVAHIRIDFDDLNLVTVEWIEELTSTAQSVPAQASVVTVGAPLSEEEGVRGVSAGMDLETGLNLSGRDAWELVEGLYNAIAAVRDLDAVTICSCGEVAIGAGFELAMACDFRLATPDAKLGLPEVNVGSPTVIMGGLLIRHVGLAKAKELIYSGELISGREALEYELVTDVATSEEYEKTLDGLVDTFAEKSPSALQWQSYVFRYWRSVGLELGMKHSIGVAASLFGTPEQQEAMRAFMENREPEFENT